MLSAKPRKCMYCGLAISALSDEHVISAAFGCKEVLAAEVCAQCNSAFGHEFEGPLANGLILFRSFFRVPNREGEVPDLLVSGKLPDDPSPFPITLEGDGRVRIPPYRLSDVKTDIGGSKEFRIFSKKQEAVIERNLRAKHSDLVWGRLADADVTQIIEVTAEFDARILISAEANRAVAKFALNYLAHKFGARYLSGRFEPLKKFVLGESTEAHVGVVWTPAILKVLPFSPPKHLFVMDVDGKLHRITILLFLFNLFPYIVTLDDPEIAVDLFSAEALDPSGGRFVPMFIGAPPNVNGIPTQPLSPERALAALLNGLACGELLQAKGAAKNAMDFITQMREQASRTTHHICYQCGQLLQTLSDNCEYCGRNPRPESSKG